MKNLLKQYKKFQVLSTNAPALTLVNYVKATKGQILKPETEYVGNQ